MNYKRLICNNMVILIAGDTHTGKTLLAQRLLEKYKYPYLSIDHLKMGLIRSRLCEWSAESDPTELANCLWRGVKKKSDFYKSKFFL